MKKIVTLLLLFCLFGCLVLSSCTDKRDGETTTTEPAVTTATGNDSTTTDGSVTTATDPQGGDQTPDDGLYNPDDWTKNY